MGADRGSKEQKDGDEYFVQTQTGLTAAEMQQGRQHETASAKSAGFGGSVQAGEEIRQAHQPDGADQNEGRTGDDQQSDDNFDDGTEHGAAPFLLKQPTVREKAAQRHRTNETEQSNEQRRLEVQRTVKVNPQRHQQRDDVDVKGIESNHAIWHGGTYQQSPAGEQQRRAQQDKRQHESNLQHQANISLSRTS
ncbi:hypothetical protein BN874_1850003 [Candidatus Contendobacter odensis Run_B_J11]|uniref:Uncharacterized protein n=1 Tax=Candidatus Contendobacter odensis Run_B_J11 TaxID=1400861 RepID=A0A7U7GA36_9GAMM|nr:hypothetical protein BN874_1850003 [Candidatus Contendobacter odensis Run_B_J11]